MIPSASRVIREFLHKKVALDSYVFDHKVTEFGGCQYWLQCVETDPDVVLISITFSPDVQASLQEVLDTAKDDVERLIEPIGQLVDACPGYLITLQADISLLRQQKPVRQKQWLQRLSCLRLAVQGAPIRCVLLQWLSGDEACAVHRLYSNPGGTWYLRPNNNNMAAVFPIRHTLAHDPVMLSALLQEFIHAEALQLNKLGLPRSTYNPPGVHPPELRDVVDDCSGVCVRSGDVVITVDKRHVTKDSINLLVWALLTFYTFLQRQTQLSKVFIHSHMRRRLDSQLQLLDKARFC